MMITLVYKTLVIINSHITITLDKVNERYSYNSACMLLIIILLY